MRAIWIISASARFLGNYSLTGGIFKLKKQADHGYMMDVENRRLKEELSTVKERRPFVGATSTTTCGTT